MKQVLAIDIGGSKLLIGVVDESGTVLETRKNDLSHPDKASLLQNIDQLVKPLLERYHPIAIGVSIPGLANPKTGICIDAVFSKIKDFPIGMLLKESYHLDTFIENDANNCAYAEKVFGLAQEVDDFIWLTISNGCGSGIFLNGKLFSGSQGNAGELGHICVTDEDVLCPCGNKGCLESVAAGPGIIRRYLAATHNLEKGISAKEIAQKAKQGDMVALAVYRKTGEYLGNSIAAAVNVLNVPLVVLGGGIAMDSALFMDTLQETVQKHLFHTANRNLKIVTTKLGYNASLIGAAANVFIHGNTSI